MSKNIQPDEIDYKEVFNKLWMSKLQILLILIISIIILFLYNNFLKPINYKSDFSINTGIYKNSTLKCSTQELGFYTCLYTRPSSSDLISKSESDNIISELKLKRNANIDIKFSTSKNSINIEASSANREELSEKIIEITNFIEEKKDESISRVTLNLNIEINTLSNFRLNLLAQNKIKNLPDPSIIEAANNLLMHKKNMLNDKSFFSTSSLAPKIITQEQWTLFNIIATLFSSLLISILVVLYRAREKVTL